MISMLTLKNLYGAASVSVKCSFILKLRYTLICKRMIQNMHDSRMKKNKVSFVA